MRKSPEPSSDDAAFNAGALMHPVSIGIIGFAFVAGPVKASFFRMTQPDPLILAQTERQSAQLDRQEQESATGLLLLQRQLQQSAVKLRKHNLITAPPRDRIRRTVKRLR